MLLLKFQSHTYYTDSLTYNIYEKQAITNMHMNYFNFTLLFEHLNHSKLHAWADLSCISLETSTYLQFYLPTRNSLNFLNFNTT